LPISHSARALFWNWRRKTELSLARMAVPKLAKNGFNSVPCVRVIFRGLDTEWKSETSAKTERGIKNHFRPEYQILHGNGARGMGKAPALSTVEALCSVQFCLVGIFLSLFSCHRNSLKFFERGIVNSSIFSSNSSSFFRIFSISPDIGRSIKVN
jgi:hypothetical protein